MYSFFNIKPYTWLNQELFIDMCMYILVGICLYALPCQVRLPRSKHPYLGSSKLLPTKKNQGSLEKCLIPELGLEVFRRILEQFALPGGKEILTSHDCKTNAHKIQF